jgi:hypothetical protein
MPTTTHRPFTNCDGQRTNNCELSNGASTEIATTNKTAINRNCVVHCKVQNSHEYLERNKFNKKVRNQFYQHRIGSTTPKFNLLHGLTSPMPTSRLNPAQALDLTKKRSCNETNLLAYINVYEGKKKQHQTRHTNDATYSLPTLDRLRTRWSAFTTCAANSHGNDA